MTGKVSERHQQLTHALETALRELEEACACALRELNLCGGPGAAPASYEKLKRLQAMREALVEDLGGRSRAAS